MLFETGIRFTAQCIILLTLGVNAANSQYLNISDIRLVGGSGPYGGRVEINLNGIWGTVCDDSFNMNDATVMCRMMNLQATAFHIGSYYGQGTGPIYAQRFSCYGSESSLRSCSYVANVQCTHARDVGIICSECGSISWSNGKLNITLDGKILSITCDEGYEANYSQSVCVNGTWSKSSLSCRPPRAITDIRLTDGVGLADGRVEVLVNGTWGTICSSSFGYYEAYSVCRMLGFSSYDTYWSYPVYSQGTGPIHLANLNCQNSYVSDINSCMYDVEHSCTHYNDVDIVCSVGKWDVGGIRLSNGTGPFDGRVELLVKGQWGTICHRSSDYYYYGLGYAETICKMMNLSFSTVFNSPVYGLGSGPILMRNLRCYDMYDHINYCTYYTAYTACNHGDDLTLSCFPCGIPPNIIETSVSINGTQLTAECYRGFLPSTITMKCLEDGHWDVVCTLATPLEITDVYLSGNTSSWPAAGQVRLHVNGTSGGICRNNFDEKDASVICRMMNLQYLSFKLESRHGTQSSYGRDKAPIFMDNVGCFGNESHINECYYDTNTNCTYWDNVAVTCGSHLNITDIRLSGASSSYSGRVEILVNGTWGTVCDNNFGSYEAYAICRTLGYSSYYSYWHSAYYGQGAGPLFIGIIDCNQQYNHLNECKYLSGEFHRCTHSQDVSVSCYGYHLNVTDIRLAGTNSSYSGRVEVLANETWGTVCHFNFYWPEAIVVCRMLGYGEYKTYYHSAYYGQGTGPILIGSLDCSSNEDHINQCSHFANDFKCSHGDDVSVSCYGPRLNITDVRLVNGSRPNEGRAEINVNGVWGTICDANFDILAADLFCQMIHMRAIQYYTGATYGPGSGPIYIEQIFCNSNDDELADCDYLHFNTCDHQRDVSVGCSACGKPDLSAWDVDFFKYNGSELFADCSYYKTYVGILKMKCNNVTDKWYVEGECTEYSYPLDVTGIRLAGGTNTSSGRVEVKSLETWGSVCSDSFGITEADTICRMMGYPPAVSFDTNGLFGPGSGPIFIDDLNCGENASHISNCTYNTHDNCEHTDDVAVTCTDCGSPAPTNGNSNSTSSNVGSVAQISCYSGYRMAGDDVITCLPSGKWSGNVPSCVYIDCGDPTPEHGETNTTATSNGTIATITCMAGYELMGNSVIVCLENDTWTDQPRCALKDCREPEPLNADVELPSNKTTYGEQAVITCRDGYHPEGSTVVTCQPNATWEQWPTCEIVDCDDPTPVKGMVNNTNTTYGTVVEVVCEEGYNLTGPSYIVCQADGTWTGSPKCDTSDCGNYPLSNGDVDTPNGTSTGAVAYASCDPGYDLDGPPTVICTALGWNSTLSCQRQDCGDPTPTNGKRTDGEGTLYGDTATLKCDEGYQLDGDQTISCQDGGTWSDTTSCLLIDCGAVDSFPNGLVNDAEGTGYDATVSFSCHSGYLLVGSTSIRCESTGVWSNNPPRCIAKSTVGDSCQADEYCLSSGAFCKNSVCTCLTGIHDNVTNTCDAMPLLPYGSSANDKVVPMSSTCASPIKFSPGIPFFRKKHTNVIVCANGYLAFDKPYKNPTPPKTRKEVADITHSEILAPFYSAIDMQRSGPVYYRTYDILNSYNRMKEDAQLISFVEDVVEKFGDVSKFETSFLLIATWTEATCIVNHLFGSTRQTSTFQVVVVSDGRTTYVFNIYGQGRMRWADDSSLSNKHCENVFVGYALDSNVYIHPMSFSRQSLQLDQRINLDVSSEYDVAGLIFKTMTIPSYVHENHAVDCIRWYNDNQADRNNLNFIASMMPECPCDIWLSRYDPWFWKIGLARWRIDVKYACVDMLPTGNLAQYGKSCCYDLKTWSWVYERPLAGGFKLYHPQKYPAENFVNDVIPKDNCCVFSDHCNLYYSLRPSGSCYQRSPYNFGRFWGDPHFRTLDGANFTFNGLGEFTMLQILTQNLTFNLQARTERAVKQDGSLSDATVFSAFAVKDSTNASVHVELNKAKTGLNVFVNTIDVTTEFNSDTAEAPFEFSPDDGNIYLAKRDGALTALFPLSEISINVSVNVGMLSLSTIVPNKWRNSTENLQGLLGNYDGDPLNDFMLPNGTVLSSNLTERQIFDYGIQWSIDGNNSAFIYAEGKNHSHFHNTSYVPRFLDEADLDKRRKAETVCNGSQSTECIFDFVFTELQEVAEATANLREQTDLDQEQLDTTVPNLVGCNTTEVTSGSTVYCLIEYDNSNDIEFVENTANATFDKNSSAIIYVQVTDSPVDIQIVSKNNKNRTSPVFQLNVILCSGCSGHGNCTQEIREDNKSTEYFKYHVCECEQEYEGAECEEEFDGCAATPCSLGRNCTKLTAQQQKLLERAYNCSACPAGYQDDGNACKDINECNVTNPCVHDCTNTEGSYMCTCRTGFRVDAVDTHTCRDINECEEDQHNCSQLCNNTAGGFKCDCYTGYQFNESTWTCVENRDAGCNASAIQRCNKTSGCTLDRNGDPVCFCAVGLELDVSGTDCSDVNECERSICSQTCNNTVGGFQCSCYTGYILVGLTDCQECEIPFWGENCKNKCVCTGRGADRCHPVKGCICHSGWQGASCDVDINECDVLDDVCTDPRHKCVNTLGSYVCSCISGYTQQADGTCADTDECSSPVSNNCSQKCTNTVGGYTCGCYSGFTTLNRTHCKDIDECSLGTHHCQQRCVNSPGSYSCFCHFGYSLNDDRHTCEKQEDPCLTERNLTCAHYCLLEGNSASCKCYDGYSLGEDNQTCADIDECSSRDLNLCDEAADCENTAGSYLCFCPAGTKLENDGRICTECDSFHFGLNCSQTCSCVHGTCDRNVGCQCDSGWAGNTCDQDIDECASRNLTCTGTNTVCVNTLGSAKCSCRTGYVNASGICNDLNECNDSEKNECDQICINTEGSYSCGCYAGFTVNEKNTCSDLNECAGSHDCTQLCENTIGSYSCSCIEGYKLNLTDRRTCKPESECSAVEESLCGAHSSCTRSSGAAVCSCIKGFYNESGEGCKDVNECSTSPSICSQLCNNSEGTFTCSCNSGFFLRDDMTTCQECGSWKFGNNCESNCSCNEINTKSCDSVLGTCQCKAGWNGTTCTKDIDECLDDLICPDNSSCNNTEGGYLCLCHTGYLKSGSGLCVECDSRHFGERCTKTCTCDVQNTLDCNTVDGRCACKQGWTGDNCTEDVDECTDLPGTCQEKTNSHCENTVGLFTCPCNDGFLETQGVCEECPDWKYGVECSHICVCNETYTEICDKTSGECHCMSGWNGSTCSDDIDECDGDVCPDNSVCINTPGSFNCQCNTGYNKSVDEISCEDVDECNLDTTGCSQLCNNTDGSYFCSCKPGYSLTSDNKSCKECSHWKYGFECTYICLCNQTYTEMCNKTSGECHCVSGWKGSTCSDDIDECDGDVCPDNSVCFNTPGSFNCPCNTGYNKSVDEISCEDVDECNLDTTGCSQLCNNTDGSYFCSCYPGYSLTSDNKTCKDVDECSLNTTGCSQLCNNTDGSYFCSCYPGYSLTSDNKTCEECTGNTYGTNCSLNCSCNGTNTQTLEQTCNTVTGKCECKRYWTGVTCDDDVNECETSSVCNTSNHEICVNTVGAFICDCLKGYSNGTDGICVEYVQTTTPAPASSLKISLTVKMDYNLTGGTTLNSSMTYEKTKAAVTASLTKFYGRFTNDTVTVIVLDIRPGSIIVDYIVIATQNEQIAAQLVFATSALAEGAHLEIDGQNITATADGFKGLGPCDLYEAAIGKCDGDRSCIVENNRVYCRYKDKSENWAAITGGTAGGLCLIIVMAIGVRWLLRQRNQKDRHLSDAARYWNRREAASATDRRIWDLKHDQYTAAGTRFPSWRSMAPGEVTPQFGGNVHASPYNIPRVRPDNIHWIRPEDFRDKNEDSYS